MSFFRTAKPSFLSAKRAEAPVAELIADHPLAAIAGSMLIGLAATRLIKSVFIAGMGLSAIQAVGRAFARTNTARPQKRVPKQPVKLQGTAPKRKARTAPKPKRRTKKADGPAVPKTDGTLH